MRCHACLLALVLVVAGAPAMAGDVPSLMTSQGVVRNTAGDVVNGVYSLTFRLHTAQTGGQLLWSETHKTVAVENGLYAVDLGSLTPLPSALFANNAQVWLGVSIEGQPELPRARVSSIAYAFNARSALVAESAQALDCSGCLTPEMLGFTVITADNVVQVVKDSNAFLQTTGGLLKGHLSVTGTLSAAVFVGDGSGLTGISSPQGACAAGWFVSGIDANGVLQCKVGASAVGSIDGLNGGVINGDVEVAGALTVNGAEVCTTDGNCGETLGQLACQAEQVAKWNGNSWVCSNFATEFNPDALPADGLNEVSNNLLHNQFIDNYVSSAPTPIKDNNPTGVVSTISVPDVGVAQVLSVSINITNSNMATVKVVLYAPDNNQYVLYDKNGPGLELGATYPAPTPTLSGNLAEWVGENPKGDWQLQVVDTGFKDNGFDGQINAWSVQLHTLSSKKVYLAGDLQLSGNIIGTPNLSVAGNLSLGGSMKVGTDSAKCDADKAGALRYQGSVLQWCNGNVWNTIGEGNAMFRWAQWSTYGQAHGWYGAADGPALFGGVNPSSWGDGKQSAHHVSSDSEVLRTLFWRKGPAIGSVKNSMVVADEWHYYSSTNSKHIGVLFRVRNNTDQPINWTVKWYRTGYGGWDEYAGLALNGTQVAYWSNDLGPNSASSNTLAIPASRTSTVVFIAASSSGSNTRSNFLAFYDNCLSLPAGLEFVDDLDYKPNGWNN